uniref:Uncharacterized protein n=1 Tax=Kryptolebias marmoratus TaxID=37003 RepID=A0A3Q3B3H2_KRYMA
PRTKTKKRICPKKERWSRHGQDELGEVRGVWRMVRVRHELMDVSGRGGRKTLELKRSSSISLPAAWITGVSHHTQAHHVDLAHPPPLLQQVG